MLEQLSQPAPRIQPPNDFRPGIEDDGYEGTATTPGYETEPDNFDEFLTEAGLDPTTIEVIGPMRTSRWQRYDGQWLTSYRFHFRRRTHRVDLPLLVAEARKRLKPRPLTNAEPRALIVLWSDLQVGKVDTLGGTDALIERVDLMQRKLVDLIKRQKPERVVFVDLGDTVENFSNKANIQQLQSNDLSIMEQVDLATTLAWQTIKMVRKLVDHVTYASVGSNHCQWRVGGQTVGKPTDDWGVFIGRQLARLSHEMSLDIRFLEPQPHDDTLALDVFDDGFHILGIAHGHQAGRPDGLAEWWRKQAFGKQPVAAASILVHGHFHHLRVLELGSTPRGTARFLIGAPTLDNGSGWFRRTSGEGGVPGLAVFELERGVDFTGTVWKL